LFIQEKVSKLQGSIEEKQRTLHRKDNESKELTKQLILLQEDVKEATKEFDVKIG
jgi:hypothetical protein